MTEAEKEDIETQMNCYLMSEDVELMDFLRNWIPDYDQNQDLAKLDDCWKTMLGEWDDECDEDLDEYGVRYLSKEECRNVMVELVTKLVKEAINNVSKHELSLVQTLIEVLNENIKI